MEMNQKIAMIYSEYYEMDIFVAYGKEKDHPSQYDKYAITDPDYECGNCKCHGFPCRNCAQFVYDGKLGEGFPKQSNKSQSQRESQQSKKNKKQLPKLSPIAAELSYKKIIGNQKWSDLSDDECDDDDDSFKFQW